MRTQPINAGTGVYAILGDPIRHALSPVIMNRMFERQGLDKVFLAFRVNRSNFAAVFPALRELGLAGYVATMPVKEDVAQAMDRLENEAELTGVVNCVVNRDGELIGHNTDSVGFWTAAIEKTGGRAPERIFVLGAGGLAKAVTAQAALRGVGRIVVANRLEETERVADFRCFVRRLGEKLPGVEVQLCAWEPESWGEEVSAADLVFNATPNGMGGKGDLHLQFPYAKTKADAAFFDAVYTPLETDFLRVAREGGHTVIDGLDLLSHQGVCSFKHWTGLDAEPAVMKRDAMRFLGGS